MAIEACEDLRLQRFLGFCRHCENVLSGFLSWGCILCGAAEFMTTSSSKTMISSLNFNKRRRSLLLPSSSHPAMALVRDLIELARSVSTCDRPPQVHSSQRRSSAALVRKMKLFMLLFEEIRDSNPPLPPSAVMVFRDLQSVMCKGKILIERCRQGSTAWLLVELRSILLQFEDVNTEMVRALEAIPLSLLEVSEEIKEQVLLLKLQSKRRKSPLADSREELLRGKLCAVLQDFEAKAVEELDADRLGKLFAELQLRDQDECEAELARLRVEIIARLNAGDMTAVGRLRSLAALVRSTRRLLYGPGEISAAEAPEDLTESPKCDRPGEASRGVEEEHDDLPDEFRCPISLEMMSDPVIIATGQTYDRNSIGKWISAGHSRCPMSGQKLIHLSLISNFALRSLIAQWCEERNIPCEMIIPAHKGCSFVDYIENTKEALEIARTTASFLVGKLATGSLEVQKQVAYELRLLAKTGVDNRVCIAEAGAIPFLVPLLLLDDPKTQEDSVTALLNLSIHDKNKRLIMAASALDPVLAVLARGMSMEARQNAAATIFSLAAMDEYKMIIGSRPSAIPALVNLLEEGSVQAKKDATSALFNLLLFPGNRGRVISAGVMPLLVEMLKSSGERELVDDALAVLALLAESSEGLEAMSVGSAAIPVLVNLLQVGSPKGKENSLSVLLALCKNGGGSNVRRSLVRTEVMASLQGLHDSGTPRARRKARSLLRFLHCNPDSEPERSRNFQQLMATSLSFV